VSSRQLVLAEAEPFLGYVFCHQGENLRELGQVRSLSLGQTTVSFTL